MKRQRRRRVERKEKKKKNLLSFRYYLFEEEESCCVLDSHDDDDDDDDDDDKGPRMGSVATEGESRGIVVACFARGRVEFFSFFFAKKEKKFFSLFCSLSFSLANDDALRLLFFRKDKTKKNVQARWPLSPDGCPHGHGRRGRRDLGPFGLGRRKPRPARRRGVPVPGVGSRQEQQAGARRRRCSRCCCFRVDDGRHRRRALLGLRARQAPRQRRPGGLGADGAPPPRRLRGGKLGEKKSVVFFSSSCFARSLCSLSLFALFS